MNLNFVIINSFRLAELFSAILFWLLTLNTHSIQLNLIQWSILYLEQIFTFFYHKQTFIKVHLLFAIETSLVYGENYFQAEFTKNQAS